MSHHPPQVSGLTLAHPYSPTLTRHRPPPSARPIDSGCAGPFLAPGQRGRNGLPRRCRFWVVTHTLIITSERSLPSSRLPFSFNSHLAASLSLAESFVFSSASTPA